MQDLIKSHNQSVNSSTPSTLEVIEKNGLVEVYKYIPARTTYHIKRGENLNSTS